MWIYIFLHLKDNVLKIQEEDLLPCYPKSVVAMDPSCVYFELP